MGEIQPAIAEKIAKLEEKFKRSGEDLGSYLDGLLYEEYVNYWDYIQLDTLLSLQKTRTPFPDETVFITYHQISELYFKLIIHEQLQILETENLTAEFFTERLDRINRYFRILTGSFDVMIKGMERPQFLKFRMSLMPASGFQSAQYRMIEIYTTSLENLVQKELRGKLSSKHTLEELYSNIYWNRGATDANTGEKTLTLRQFEDRYNTRFLRIAEKYKGRTIWERYNQLPFEEKNNKLLIEALRRMDTTVNVNWLLVHIGAAQRYLMAKEGAIKATGGTNWKQFLPPSFQKIVFFPDLWSEEELADWGKEWVEELIQKHKEELH